MKKTSKKRAVKKVLKLDASKEFVVGKYGIGYVWSGFKDRLYTESFTPVSKMGGFQTLAKRMSDSEIEAQIKPGICTLGDVFAFLKDPPEKSKDGYWNLFYLESCVVGVFWNADDRGWRVSAWSRGGVGWGVGGRVFSPATDARSLDTGSSNTPDTLPSELTINGVVYRQV